MMKLAKSLVLGLTLSAALATSAYADKSVLTPAEIKTLATVATIDNSEILISVVALNKTNNSGVTNLAQMMVTQHGSNLTQVLGMPKNSAPLAFALSHGTAEKLVLDTNKDLTNLGALQGDQFDHAYVDAMVSGHATALHLIDTQLMKTATSADMKKFMTDTRAAVVNHLNAAKALQEKM